MYSTTSMHSSTTPGDFEAAAWTRRANRRRLVVFLATFVVVAIAGLIYDYARPAVYEANARLNFATPSIQRIEVPAPGSAPVTGDRPFSVSDEMQYLSSRPLLTTVWDGLKHASVPPPDHLSVNDPVATLQAMLSVQPVDQSRIVVLRARGGQPEFLAAFLDRLTAAYQESLAKRYQVASSGELVDIGDEARKLQDAVVAKRKQADAFRAQYNIVSVERDENQVLSEVKGTSTALNLANEKLVAAEGRVKALEESQAAGRSVTRARDNPTLAELEKQAATIRADLREVARTFTPEYMDIDPRVKSQRARLADLEQQIVAQGQSSQGAAMQEAREALVGARAAVASLRAQLAANQQSVQSFTSRFNEYAAMQEEVKRLEVLRQKAVERQAALGAESGSRRPQVQVVEGASVPTSPASPPYARDAGIALACALVAALLTMGIVELFNRPPARPATIVVPQTWSARTIDGPVLGALGADAARMQLDVAPAPVTTPVLPAPLLLPRELGDDELAALMAASDERLRVAIALLAIGVAPHEVVALQSSMVDREHALVRVADRTIAIPPGVASLIADLGPSGPGLVTDRNGVAMTEAALDARLLYAAHDAGLDDVEEITAAAIHHTYAAWLVRQGIRFSDLAGIVGHLDADRLRNYARLAPPGSRRSLETLDAVLPAIRGQAPTSAA